MLRSVLLMALFGYVAAQFNSEDILDIFGPPREVSNTINMDPEIEEEDAECTTEDNERGRCVAVNLCKTVEKQIVVVIRVSASDLGYCPSYLEVCCSPSRILNTSIIPILSQTSCGFSNRNGVMFTASDNEITDISQFGEFPWVVSIMRETTSRLNLKNTTSVVCGGSLIHPSVILTAAHCIPLTRKGVPMLQGLQVRAGEWDTMTEKEPLSHQTRNIRSVLIHNRYKIGILLNDMALLFLERPMDISPHIGVLCLPPEQASSSTGRCIATGWNKSAIEHNGTNQEILKKVDLPIVSNPECQKMMRNTVLGKNFVLDRSFICAGGEAGKDTCKGDGGSPLVCPMPGFPDRYFQAGIVSWGISCGEPDVPGVYTNVRLLRPWIDDNLKINNIDMSEYKT